MVTDFGPDERAERSPQAPAARLTGMKEVFTPATEEEIAVYRDEKYPAWIESCEDILRNYHCSLQQQSGPPLFSFVVSNEGTRPGRDVLVTIEAQGRFRIMPPHRDDGEDKERGEVDAIVELPRPPRAPRGKWQLSFGGVFGSLRSVSSLQRTLGSLSGFKTLGTSHRELHFPRIPDLNPRRDPNAFYWKPDRPIDPQSSFSLECEQWRHGPEEEVFPGEVYFADDEGEVSGVLECRIQAENLSYIAQVRIPVRIQVERVDVSEMAETLVDQLRLKQ